MIKILYLGILSVTLLLIFGFTKPLSTLVPEGYVITERHYGDLNKDGVGDSVFIIKGTDSNRIVEDHYNHLKDRNRRGIMIFFKKDDHWELGIQNLDCFLSENEDGGVYFPPELDIRIDKSKLYIEYSHGRYGYWGYTFRLNGSDFELIGYDSSSTRGPVINSEISINFLTKKRLTKQNTNFRAETGGDEVFKETWDRIEIDHLIKLSEIEDFNELDI